MLILLNLVLGRRPLFRWWYLRMENYRMVDFLHMCLCATSFRPSVSVSVTDWWMQCVVSICVCVRSSVSSCQRDDHSLHPHFQLRHTCPIPELSKRSLSQAWHYSGNSRTGTEQHDASSITIMCCLLGIFIITKNSRQNYLCASIKQWPIILPSAETKKIWSHTFEHM